MLHIGMGLARTLATATVFGVALFFSSVVGLDRVVSAGLVAVFMASLWAVSALAGPNLRGCGPQGKAIQADPTTASCTRCSGSCPKASSSASQEQRAAQKKADCTSKTFSKACWIVQVGWLEWVGWQHWVAGGSQEQHVGLPQQWVEVTVAAPALGSISLLLVEPQFDTPWHTTLLDCWMRFFH